MKRNPHERPLLRGERVDLRPIEPDDLATLHAWQSDPQMFGPFQVPRPSSLPALQRRYLESPTLSAERGALLAVRKDGVAVGLLSYHKVSFGPASPAMSVGIEIAPEQRGQGFGAEAQRLLADYLLATFPIGRVGAGTDIENLAEQRALERAGFQREGVARSAAWRSGRWHDMVVFSRVHGDR